MVFVCFDDETPSLAEYADAEERLQNPFGSPDLQVRVVRRQRLKANWKMQPENSRDGYHAPAAAQAAAARSPPRPYRTYPHGHTVQLLGLDYEAGLTGQTVDPILAENPELTRKFMEYPLPGMTREDPAYVVTLFPELLILARYSTLLIERQVPSVPAKLWWSLELGI